MTLPDRVRAHVDEVVAGARAVRIDEDVLADLDPGPVPPADGERHLHDADPEDTADYVLTLNAVNFGSGWFPTLDKRPGCSGYWTVASSLTDRFREHGPFSAAELRAIDAPTVAAVLGQRSGHPLMALYAEAWRSLGLWLGDRRAADAMAEAANGTAAGLAEAVVDGMPFYRDFGLYKRAQILAADLEAFGLVRLGGLDELTMFADNLVPHVLRCAGVLVYDDDLAVTVDAGEPIPLGLAEHEIRCSAVRAVELLSRRTGVPARSLDAWLWHAGQRPEIKARPRHRCRTVFY